MSFIPFIIAALVLAFTPGPGITYVVARTVAGGRTEGFASCLGTAIGGIVHVLAAALGLSLIIAQSALAFNLLKYVGAAYLVYLGVRMLLRQKQPIDSNTVQSQGARRALIEGILVETLNVKTALFFLAFLPQFVSSNEPLAFQLVLLGSICVTLNTFADLVAVLIAYRLVQSSVVRQARTRLINRLSGATMLGLAAFLALAKRDE